MVHVIRDASTINAREECYFIITRRLEAMSANLVVAYTSATCTPIGD